MFDKLETILAPVAEKLSTNKVLVAIRDGFLIATPLIIASSIYLLIQNFPVSGYPEFMAGIFGPDWAKYLGSVGGATFNLLALLNVFGIGYSYARELKATPVSGAVVAVVAFLIITPQSHPGFVNEAGRAFSGFAYANLNSGGLFLGMISAIVSVRIFVFAERKGWIIRMPEGVPPMVAESFSALIPSLIAMTFFFLVRVGFGMTDFEYAHNFVLVALQTPLMGLGKNAFYPIIYQFLSTVFWFFGINGPAVTNTVFGPISTALTQENLLAFQAGAIGNALPNIYTSSFSNFFGNYGGGGSTLSLVLVMLFFGKSERVKKLSRLSIVPGIFGINEMVIFGLPIVLNPVIIIPFVLVPVMNISLAYLATMANIIPRTFGLPLPWTTPIFFSGWLATGSFRAAFFQLFLLALGCLVYYPFFKILDRQYLHEEHSNSTIELDEVDEFSFDDVSFD